MGYVLVPDWLYENILTKEISFWVGMGYPYEQARQEALARMARGIVAQSVSGQDDFQKDHDEYQEEMSLGGRPYRVPR